METKKAEKAEAVSMKRKIKAVWKSNDPNAKRKDACQRCSTRSSTH